MHGNLAPRPKNFDFPVGAPLLEKPRVVLPVVPLEDLDLSNELYNQYIIAKQLLEDAGNEPLNQKAQTLNSIVAILKSIAATRTDLYNAERLKKMEGALLKTLKDFPELSEAFLVSYEEALAAI